jgi:hypothetical protein|tara:strand:- start:316 stop:786 length:471 start_codon:yes stop_codon:yes gene_type:complete
MTTAYTAYVASDGQIQSLITYGSEAPEEGAVVDGFTVHNVTDAILRDNSITDLSIFVSRFLWKDSAWTDRGVPASDFYLWSGTAWVINTAHVIGEVRALRNSFLSESDWTQNADSPLTDVKIAEWATYRQALRDKMASLSSELDDPEDVVWPTTPL